MKNNENFRHQSIIRDEYADNGPDIFSKKMQEDFAELAEQQIHHDNKVDKIVTFVRDKPLFSVFVSVLTGCFVSWLFSSKKK